MKKLLPYAVLMMAAGSANAAVMTIGDVTLNSANEYQISSNAGVSDSNVESFLSLSAGTLDSISTGNATEGSAILDSFTVNAGDVFGFDWTWITSEAQGTSYNDFAFVNLSLSGISVLIDAAVASGSTGSFSWTATSSGVLEYGIGVMDVNDAVVDSTLVVSNLSSQAVDIPEPSSLALLGLGLLGFAFRKKKQA
jgi:hypothetical protein